MRMGGFKDGIAYGERRFIVFIGVLLLLAGLARLTEHANVDGFAALATMIGLFAVCLLVVKRRTAP